MAFGVSSDINYLDRKETAQFNSWETMQSTMPPLPTSQELRALNDHKGHITHCIRRLLLIHLPSISKLYRLSFAPDTANIVIVRPLFLPHNEAPPSETSSISEGGDGEQPLFISMPP